MRSLCCGTHADGLHVSCQKKEKVPRREITETRFLFEKISNEYYTRKTKNSNTNVLCRET